MSTLTRTGEILGCRHGEARLSRKLTENGGELIGVFCSDCRRWVTREKGYPGLWLAIDHPDLLNLDLDRIPVVDGYFLYRRCEWCAEWRSCEAHHAAPQKLFGEDAHEFPLLYLCRSCHERWHQVLTPGLCTPYDPTVHAQILRSYLSQEQIAALLSALRAAKEAA